MPAHLNLDKRSCGILMHPTSLPGAPGCGDLGPAAYQFAQFLAQAGQKRWQFLPIGPPGPGNSPYSSPSAFAASPLFADINNLVEQGLLHKSETPQPNDTHPASADFHAAAKHRTGLLHRAHNRFTQRRHHAAFDRFCNDNRHWLNDYALFTALKAAHASKPWTQWDTGTRLRHPDAIRHARRELKHAIDYERFVQFILATQFAKLKKHCHRLGIGLIGDIPFFVQHDSADAWANRELFQLAPTGLPQLISGVPPDRDCPDGQLWGHPLYRWPNHRAAGFKWWLDRFTHELSRFDALRIDHFFGFHRCWATPATHKSAKRGKWTRSPGNELLTLLTNKLTRPPLIAENLGHESPAGGALLKRFNIPGMKILQHAFAQGSKGNLPHNYPKRCVAYTGNHDNNTAVGWFNKLPSKPSVNKQGPSRQDVRDDTGQTHPSIHWDLIRTLYMSPANLVMLPLQDALGLDEKSRMNTPGTPIGNWRWRLHPDTLKNSARLAAQLRNLAETYKRSGP